MIRQVLADYRTAPIPEKLRTMLGFVEKLTLRPAEVGPDDAAALREAGLSDEEIEDAVHVCALFNIINRVADSLGFEPASADGYEKNGRWLVNVGYK
ncbi:MAG TPA: peroxidase [Thermoanaerobaculia bacterium]|nr:peroxidase [Thermoanaerobaculia bacterium]